MKILLTASLLVLFSITAYGQQTASPQETADTNQVLARNELKEAANAYKAGKFAEAQRHSEMALAVDPTNRIAPVFVARSIHAQFIPFLDSPENRNIALEAIAAYQRIRAKDPLAWEPLNAIGALYHAIGEFELEEQWWLNLAVNTTLPVTARREGYRRLANQKLDCANRIAAENEGDQGGGKSGARKIKSLEQNRLALVCATDGLRYINEALELDATVAEVWRQKSDLLAQVITLTKLDGRRADAEAYRRERVAVERKYRELAAAEDAAPRR